jgi:hypothetical protein
MHSAKLPDPGPFFSLLGLLSSIVLILGVMAL